MPLRLASISLKKPMIAYSNPPFEPIPTCSELSLTFTSRVESPLAPRADRNGERFGFGGQAVILPDRSQSCPASRSSSMIQTRFFGIRGWLLCHSCQLRYLGDVFDLLQLSNRLDDSVGLLGADDRCGEALELLADLLPRKRIPR
jgi:hypothetical protein